MWEGIVLSPNIARYVASVLATFMILIATLSLGASNPMSELEAEAISRWLSIYLGGSSGVLELAIRIFLNNLAIALMGFVPAAGPPLLALTLYDSGRYLGWLVAKTGLPTNTAPLLIFIISLSSPVIQMEFLAYSFAIVESVKITANLARCALRRNWPSPRVLLRGATPAMLAIIILLVAAASLEAVGLEPVLRGSHPLPTPHL